MVTQRGGHRGINKRDTAEDDAIANQRSGIAEERAGLGQTAKPTRQISHSVSLHFEGDDAELDRGPDDESDGETIDGVVGSGQEGHRTDDRNDDWRDCGESESTAGIEHARPDRADAVEHDGWQHDQPQALRECKLFRTEVGGEDRQDQAWDKRQYSGE